MSALPKDIWEAKRTCYLVYLDDEGDDLDLRLTHMSQITAGDLFCLEAAHPYDPLHGSVVVERLYRANADAYKVGGAWQVEAELL